MNQTELSGFVIPIILEYLSNTGNLTGTFYPLNFNPSGYEQSGAFISQEDLDSALTQTISYLFQTFYLDSNPSGYITYNQASGLMTGYATTGNFYPLSGNPSGYVTSGVLSATTGSLYSQLYSYITGLSSGLSGIVSGTGIFTGLFYPLGTNPSGYISSSQTGTLSGAFVTINGAQTITGQKTFNVPIIANTIQGNTGSTISLNSGSISFNSNPVLSWGNLGSASPISGNIWGWSIASISTNQLIRGYGQGGPVAIDLINSYLKHPSTVVSIDWPNNYLYANTGGSQILSIDWGNRILSGNWNVQNLLLSGVPLSNLYVTSAQLLNTSGVLFGQIYNQGLTFTNQINTLDNWTGISTGLYYPLKNNPSGFINTGQTGVLAPEHIGLPTDGVYGGPNGPIAGITQGDRHEDAFDKIETILGKLAPSKPPYLSQSTFNLTAPYIYSAVMQGTQNLFSNVISGGFFTGLATGFYDGSTGNLSGFINGNLTGFVTLSTGITGNFTGLKVISDYDYWNGIVGKAGFWYAVNAQIVPTGSMPSGKFTMQMAHSSTGPTNIITGYVDFPMNPSTLVNSYGTGICTTRTIDGIVSLATNDNVTINLTIRSGVGAFYSSPIASVSSPQLNGVNLNTTGFPLSGQPQTLSGLMTVSNSQYTTGAVLTINAYNSLNQSFSSIQNTNLRIDTVSSQQAQRATAGSGQFPTIGYNNVYNNNISISGNEELQMINGQIQYPPAVNYGIYLPSSFNYSNLPSGSFSGYRWSMFNMGTVTSASNLQVTFNNSNNFGSSALIGGLLLYAQISGSTAGWIDGNAAYPGVGNPTNNGDAALVIGSSSPTVKLITFGTIARSGPAYIRVGIPSGSNKTFSSISMVQM